MSLKVCDKCGTSCSPDARFCRNCRHPLGAGKATKCARGHRMDPSWSQCPFCRGAEQAAQSAAAAANPLFEQPTPPQQPAPKASLSRERTVVEGQRVSVQVPPLPATREGVPEPFRVNDPGNTPTPRMPQPVVPATSDPSLEPLELESPTPAPSLPRDKTRVVTKASAKIAKGRITGVLVSFSRNPSGQPFLIRLGRTLLGSAEAAQIRIDDPSVSDKHAIISAGEKRIVIDDCLSTNGTWVNGEVIEEPVSLAHGDIIQTGDMVWRFARIDIPDQA